MKKLFSKIFQAGVPLRPTLVSSVILAILLTLLSIGIPVFFSFKKSVGILWTELGKKIALGTAALVTAEFHQPPGILEFMGILYDLKILDLEEQFQLMDVCYAEMQHNPHVVWVYFAKTDGTICGVYRDPASKEIIGEVSFVNQGPPDAEQRTKNLHYALTKENKWVQIEEKWDNYDPRVRPWWKGGVEHPEGHWSDPYVAYDPRLGVIITYNRAQKKDGKIMGLWTIDYQTQHISYFLQSLTAGTSERVILMDENGMIIADSSYRRNIIAKSINDADFPDKTLVDIIKKAKVQKSFGTSFAFGDYLATLSNFSASSKMEWQILTIVSKSDFFGPIHKAVWIALIFGVPLCLIFILLSMVFFGRVSERLKKITYVMDEVGSLRFPKEELSRQTSFIREVNIMSKVLDRMKAAMNSVAKYVPKDLVFELIRSGESAILGGKRMQLTMLFSDLANFTRVSEQLSSENLMKILDEYFEKMSDIIQEHHGIVDKYIGDSIFAFWGAPALSENHAFAACQCALEMQKCHQTLWQDVAEESKNLLKQRIGIHTGKAFVGNIGSKARFEYTAIGDDVNLASRLEGLNKLFQTQILISEDTAKFVKDKFVLRPIVWVAVKGRHQATLVYELLGYKGDIEPAVLQAISAYEKALESYRQRAFLQAAKQFHEANALFGGADVPSKLLAAKSEAYQASPPGDDWKGTLIMEQK